MVKSFNHNYEKGKGLVSINNLSDEGHIKAQFLVYRDNHFSPLKAEKLGQFFRNN